VALAGQFASDEPADVPRRTRNHDHGASMSDRHLVAA
jgi:hypothetical protein